MRSRHGSFAPPLTTIIATIGPASRNHDALRQLMDAGVSIFRMNFGHGSLERHEANLDLIRGAAAGRPEPVAVMGDLQGPKLRIDSLDEAGIETPTGATVEFRKVLADSDGIVIPCSAEDVYREARSGHRLLVDDGAIRMEITETHRDRVVCTVHHGGVVKSRKGINLPDSDEPGGAITDHDRQCIEWAVRNRLDFLALSFVGDAEDVRQLQRLISDAARREGDESMRIPIVAKIERPRAVTNIDAIVEVADGVMVARGDLGVEMDLAEVPVIQKKLIAAAQSSGKPAIVATQMLQSMIEAPHPTRAEVSDVATAIFDHADAIMLSGETAVGRFPVESVSMMRRTAKQAEQHLRTRRASARPPARLQASRHRVAALAHGVWTVANAIDATMIVVWSQEGGGARYLSSTGFEIPIVACSTDERAVRQMHLYRGVLPVHMSQPNDLAHFTSLIDAHLCESGWAVRGDPVVLVAGRPIGTPGVTNSLALHWVGDRQTGFY